MLKDRLHLAKGCQDSYHSRTRSLLLNAMKTIYHNTSYVTNIHQQLNWESLCQHRAKMRLTMFYKSQHALVALPKCRPTTDQTSPPLHSFFPVTLLLNRCLQIQLLPPHSCPVEQSPSINSNNTIS